MAERAVWSTFEARPGREAEVEVFLQQCRDEIERELGTTTFFAMKIGPGRYATFDTFAGDAAFEAHLRGRTADAVRGRAAELFVDHPMIVQAIILAAKDSSERS